MASEARVALITGCGKPVGIGNSTARALAAAGVTVVVSDLAPPASPTNTTCRATWTPTGPASTAL